MESIMEDIVAVEDTEEATLYTVVLYDTSKINVPALSCRYMTYAYLECYICLLRLL